MNPYLPWNEQNIDDIDTESERPFFEEDTGYCGDKELDD